MAGAESKGETFDHFFSTGSSRSPRNIELMSSSRRGSSEKGRGERIAEGLRHSPSGVQRGVRHRCRDVSRFLLTLSGVGGSGQTRTRPALRTTLNIRLAGRRPLGPPRHRSSTDVKGPTRARRRPRAPPRRSSPHSHPHRARTGRAAPRRRRDGPHTRSSPAPRPPARLLSRPRRGRPGSQTDSVAARRG